MHRVAVFAGLGSDSLFSLDTFNQSRQFVSESPQSQILLRTCHSIFRRQIHEAIERGHLAGCCIDLDDFLEPETLLRPPPKYHRNVFIQHTTLYLVQIIRYIHVGWADTKLRGVAGFCLGLLPAAAIATAQNEIELLQRTQDFFQIALWLGILCEAYRNSQDNSNRNVPWSVIVDKLPKDTEILTNAESTRESKVFVSARNSPSCVTLSGRGDDLAQFLAENLPPQCRIRSTNVFTLYHDRERLQATYMKMMEYVTGEHLHTPVRLVTPLFSSVTGSPITLPDQSLQSLIKLLLEMILQEPVNWVAVQRSIITELGQHKISEPCEILNYGPGYGFSRSAVENASKSIRVRDFPPDGKASGNAPTQVGPDDVAIVGMAVELPDANDASELWDNLCNGTNSCSEIPPSRFDVNEFFHKQDADGKKSKRSINTRYGNFLKNPFLFDNDLFDISPREAKSMDPQQRVLLQTSYRALEDAGYVPDSTPSNSRESFGCFIGNATLDYTENLRAEIDVYYSPGTLRAFQSGRISYFFGWSGPSITLDTACSSSMVALHQAVRAISSGDCRAALVGGVNVITSPDMYLGLDRAHFLSSTGQCKAFDASADGYSRSEGCGIFVVKKVRDALAEGDRIHAVIKGIEANQSGNTHSITHPHAPTQEQLFTRLFDRTKIHPHHISVVETHGTGTQAGDPNEIESLRNALCFRRDSRNPLYFTSIKANIGHCEAASGAAALAKVILMMAHRKISPQIALHNLNPKIKELGVDGAIISRDAMSWNQLGDRPRLALINNFGAAGSNAAMILREYKEPPSKSSAPAPPRAESQTYMLGLSGKSAKVVSKLRDDLIAFLTDPSRSELSLADICYSLTARRQLYSHRLAVAVDSAVQLIENLRHAKIVDAGGGKTNNNRIVFVFSGQGSQYVAMGQQLMSIYPVFARAVYKIDRVLQENNFPSCLSIIDPTSTESPSGTSQWQAFQTTIFALQVALAQLLESWGVLPHTVIGHSLGEYAALVTAGVLDVSSGALFVARRAQLMTEECQLEETSMLAVNLAASSVREMIASNDRLGDLVISCDNGPNDCVVGGDISQLKTLKEELQNVSKTKSKLLDVPLAYHTGAVAPILSGLEQAARTLVLQKPRVPVISNVLGRTIQVGEEDVFTPEYFVRHSREMVAFQQGLSDYMLSDSPVSVETHWVEVGPHASLLPMILAQTDTPPANLLPCLRKGTAPSTTLSQLMSHLFLKAVPVDWREAFHFKEKPRLVNVPTLPFFQTEFVVPYPREMSPLFTGKTELLPSPVANDVLFFSRTVQKATSANGFTGIYETPIQSLKDFITGHMVCGHALCPASVYHQLVLLAMRDVDFDDSLESRWSLRNIGYVAPLLYTSESSAQVRVSVEQSADSRNEFQFEVSSLVDEGSRSSGGSSSIHCRGHVRRKIKKSIEHKYVRAARRLERQAQQLSDRSTGPILETLSTKAMYETVFPRVVTYSELYQQVRFIRISPDYGEAFARCAPFRNDPSTPHDHNIVFMDVLLHVAGFVANMSMSAGEAGICREVSTALVLREPTESFDVYCTLTPDADHRSIVANAQARDSQGLLASFKGMVFQQVQLAKVGQAFSLASKKREPHAPPKMTQPALRTVGDDGDATISVPRIEDVPSLEHSRSTMSRQIRELITQTSGAGSAHVSPNTTLEELGFDSLLMIELEGQLSAANYAFDSSGLAECVTVGDVEKLCCFSEQTSETPPSPTNSPPIADPITAMPAHRGGTLDIQKLTRAIISETCSADSNSIDSASELASLGIDSLMMHELESSLMSSIKPGGKFMSSDLSECRTVGDVENLMIGFDPAAEPTSTSTTHDAPTRPFTSGASSASATPATSTTSSACATSAFSATPTDTILSTEPQVFFPPSTLDKLSHVLNLNQQPEIIQTYHPSSTDTHPQHRDPPPPLFLIHDGSGICTHYHRLASLHRPVYALHDPQFLDLFSTWPTLEDMAAHYADIIASTAPGPYLLGGWSFGGVVAYEIARQLSRTHAVIGTILIDAPPPVSHTPLSSRIIDAVIGTESKTPASETTKAVRALTRRSFHASANLLSAFHPAAADTPDVFLLRSQNGWIHPSVPEIENAWLQDRFNPETALTGWKTLTRASTLRWADIPGNHFQVFDRVNVGAVTAGVDRAARELERAFAKRDVCVD